MLLAMETEVSKKKDFGVTLFSIYKRLNRSVVGLKSEFWQKDISELDTVEASVLIGNMHHFLIYTFF